MADDRSSEADHPQLVTDPTEIARIEAENTLRQFDDSMVELVRWTGNPTYQLRVSTILRFNRLALTGVSAYAGTFRPGTISISGSTHTPPPASDVPELMEAFCDYINSNWLNKSAIHLSAYALWRLNWIHPFVDGNGRTARAVSYLILCSKLGYRLPGRQTIPEQIAAAQKPYYVALEAADRAAGKGHVDVSELETLLDEHLARQLLHIHSLATAAGSIDRAAMAALHSVAQHAPAKDIVRISRIRRFVQHIEHHPVIYGAVVAVVLGVAAILFQK